MIRDPRDCVVSGYFYHLWTNEAWAHQPQDLFNGLSYQQHLNRSARKMGWRRRSARLPDMRKHIDCETGTRRTIGFWRSNTKICWRTNRALSPNFSGIMVFRNRRSTHRFNWLTNAVSRKSPVERLASRNPKAIFAAANPASGKRYFPKTICVWSTNKSAT